MKKNIPDGWRVVKLGNCLANNPAYGINAASTSYSLNLPTYIRITDISDDGNLIKEKLTSVNHENSNNYYLSAGDIVFARTGASVGKTYLYKKSDGQLVFAGFLIRVKTNIDKLIPEYLYFFTKTHEYWKWILITSSRSGQPGINSQELKSMKFNIPPVEEQNRIVAVLEVWDKAIEKLTRKIKCKQNIKKGLMQQLLIGKKRLPGFTGEWRTVKLEDVAICLDNRRIPLNSSERLKRTGEIPYCGANGIVDYIDNYIFDEDIILIAEDGGHFDEYVDYPIAYRMKVKCWVNNHAHIIKVKNGFSQDLLFYLTVHKNILKYLNGGTRAKLNKSELLSIKYFVPNNYDEQTAITNILTAADDEITALEKQLTLLKEQKKYLLNNLVTGTIRTPTNLLDKTKTASEGRELSNVK